jgi:hypothetical protein
MNSNHVTTRIVGSRIIVRISVVDPNPKEKNSASDPDTAIK